MNAVYIPNEAGEVSDGYHTFNELYDHRCILFLALMAQVPTMSWISNMHDDGSTMDGWSIAGITLPTGTVTYHIPNKMWSLANKTGATYLTKAPKWDGHTGSDVLKRLQGWIEQPHQQPYSES